MKITKEEEQKEEYRDVIPNQCHYLNSSLQYDEILEALESFVFCIRYYNGWYWLYLISNAEQFAW